MAKLRIHELAKELGLENKDLLELCAKIGLSGKTSHSNTLTDDEADKLRRAVLRQAVGGSVGIAKDVEREDGKFTERRLGGNIIRRRKREDTPEDKEEKIDLNAEALQNEPQFAVSVPNFADEKAIRDQALASADALFEEETPPTVEPESAKVEPTWSELDLFPTEPVATDNDAVVAMPEVQELPQLSSEELLAKERTNKLNAIRERHGVKAPNVLGTIVLPTVPGFEKKESEEITKKEKLKSKTSAAKNKDKKGLKGKDFDELDETPKFQKKTKRKVLEKDDLVDMDDESSWRTARLRERNKKKQEKVKTAEQPLANEMRASKKVIKMQNEIIVSELAKSMQVKSGEIIKKLMSLGVLASINQLIDFETAELIASEYGYSITKVGDEEDELGILAELKQLDAEENLILRPPVVTIMGHVDHGKTTLLDAIRNSSVTASEAGGITQHIGAYKVTTKSGGQVTFIDTPGHAAFTEMRGRGAKVTDIVVLVVAADDGIMPQTIEAINHAKAASVPIIVAINKIDKPGANIEKTKQQLTEYELVPEDWGGQTIICPVSAKSKEGLDNLLENLALQAEILELKANPNRSAIGTVIESKVDKGRGPVTTILVQNGTLEKGDAFIAGITWGKVRAMSSYDGKSITAATPSMPVEILGAESAPLAGEEFLVIKSEAAARRIAEIRQSRARLKDLAHKSGGVGAPLTLDYFAEITGNADKKELNLIIKADVQGSVEAVSQALERLTNNEVTVRVLHKAVGAVNENDIQLALASNAILIAFNIRADARATELAEKSGVEIRYSRIIYELIENIEAALKGFKAPVFKENILGRVEVRQTFKVPKIGIIAGCYITSGMVKRNSLLRLLRDNVVVFEGKMASLRRAKDDVKEVQAGYECGIGIEGYHDFKEGDVLEVYVMEQVEV
ncbi:MAG: translation initiation factor IF-2 [Deltaproteobacteria bacterium]|jgi:translation initiation factor IF-2|nr:translation initiation factor IF-2 [Deltaproteobacteria bacterium]